MLDMILLCLDQMSSRKLKIYAKNGLIWRVTILEVWELRDVSLVKKNAKKV
jgi:hypothetical protein